MHATDHPWRTKLIFIFIFIFIFIEENFI